MSSYQIPRRKKSSFEAGSSSTHDNTLLEVRTEDVSHRRNEVDSREDLGLLPGDKTYRLIITQSQGAINAFSFKECKMMKEVVLPDSVIALREGCFQNCTELETVILPSGVIRLDEGAFRGCSKLKHIKVRKVREQSLIDIQPSELAVNEGLQELDSLQQIGAYCFYDTALETVTLPSSLILWTYTFANIKTLRRVIFQEPIDEVRVFQIGWYTFKDCTNLVDVELSSRCKTITEEMFCNCTSLEKVKLFPVEVISAKAFSGCSSLQSVIFGRNLRVIGQSSFNKCSSLKTLNFPMTLQKVNSYAFYECSNLRTVYMFMNDIEIYDYVFLRCNLLYRVYLFANNESASDEDFREWIEKNVYQKWNRNLFSPFRDKEILPIDTKNKEHMRAKKVLEESEETSSFKKYLFLIFLANGELSIMKQNDSEGLQRLQLTAREIAYRPGSRIVEGLMTSLHERSERYNRDDRDDSDDSDEVPLVRRLTPSQSRNYQTKRQRTMYDF